MALTDELERLAALRASGAITEEEFQVLKARAVEDKSGAPPLLEPPIPPPEEKATPAAAKNSAAGGCVAVVVFLIALGGFISTQIPSAEERARTQAINDAALARNSPSIPAPPQQAAPAKEPSDLRTVAEKHLAMAATKCKPRIERLGKYSFEWTNGWLELILTRYKWEDEKAGTVTYMGDAIRFQNGFGAFQPHRYSCTFDTKTEQVLDVTAAPGRLQ